MTKEELEKEAEVYSYKLYHSKAWNPGEDMLVKAYLAGAEPREKQIQVLGERCLQLQADKGNLTDRCTDLEAEVKEWKDKADLWCKTANLKDHNIMINRELEQENERLKEINTHTLSQLNLDNGELITQLNKSKKLIRYLCEMVRELSKPNPQPFNVEYSLKEAEQFLKNNA